MQETQLWSLAEDDPLQKEMAAQSSPPLPGEFHEQRGQAGYSPWDRKEVDVTVWLSLSCVEFNLSN